MPHSIATAATSPALPPPPAAEEEGLGSWSYASTSDPSALKWSGWEGLGGPEPSLVPGLHKVQRVALGATHALAVVA